ncbi:hypothetical protein M3231_08090 [Neobacillus mesonae]|nr:hypothetical protein [Neobacillus mesonae]
MSLKAVELQIAVPRTSEVGRYQSEYDHRRSSEQSLLADNQMKKEKKEAKQSPKTNESEQASIKNQRNSAGSSSDHVALSNNPSPEEEVEAVSAEHPFKGKHFDVSL